jgi:hypothetical protein
MEAGVAKALLINGLSGFLRREALCASSVLVA